MTVCLLNSRAGMEGVSENIILELVELEHIILNKELER